MFEKTKLILSKSFNKAVQLGLAGISITSTGALVYDKATDIDAPASNALGGMSTLFSFVKDNIYVLVWLTLLSITIAWLLRLGKLRR